MRLRFAAHVALSETTLWWTCCRPVQLQCSSWYRLLHCCSLAGPVGSDVLLRLTLTKLSFIPPIFCFIPPIFCFILPRNGQFCSFVSFLLISTGSAKNFCQQILPKPSGNMGAFYQSACSYSPGQHGPLSEFVLSFHQQRFEFSR